MRFVRLLCLSVSSAIGLASCANVSGTYQFDQAKSVGLAVGSITYDSAVGEYLVSVIAVEGNGRDGRPTAGVFKVGGTGIAAALTVNDSELKARGGTFAVELPAGHYMMKRWSIRQGPWTYAAQRDIGIPFAIEPGKSTYLGNFHFDAKSEVALKDEAARDLPVLRSRFSALTTAPLAFALAPGAVVQKIGGDYDTRLEFPAYVPVVVPVRK